jgi:hypothetical protein
MDSLHDSAMTRDFTVQSYRRLLEAFLRGGYACRTYLQHVEERTPSSREVILRHDVDLHPDRSLRIAQLQHEMGVAGTYYFRSVRESFVPTIIEKIAALGHEIGYHYEDLTLARGDVALALELFERNLARLRAFYPVRTVCMHGSPMTRWDNRDIWNAHDYRAYGISAEPYFDTDFTQVFYITDTGRSWNRTAVSVRDKVPASLSFTVRNTEEFADRITRLAAPKRIMMNIHPQRWNDDLLPWMTEFVGQTFKNQVKRLLLAARREDSI